MIEHLLALYQVILDYAKPWPAAQAAIVTTSSLVFTGGIGFLLWKLPQRTMYLVRTQCMTKLSFSTASTNWSEYNSRQYIAFLEWFSKNSWFKWSRVITLDGGNARGSVGPGVGTHFFIYKHRFYFFTIAEDQANQSNQSKYRISISTLGRSKGPLFRLMDAFMDVDAEHHQLNVFESEKSDWRWITRMNKRDPNTVVVSDKVQTELLDPLVKFQTNRDWYRKRGFNYKFTVLLYGPPGTGKSSLAAAIASMLNRPIHILKPDGTSSYNTLLQSAKGGVVLIEDIDTYSVSRRRDNQETDPEFGIVKKIKKERDIESNSAPVAEPLQRDVIDEYLSGNLSELLNGLDGVLGLDDVIVIMTTNHPEQLDEALIRDERVDARVCIDYLEDKELRRYVELMFPGETYVANTPFNSLPGATVQKTFKSNPTDVQRFVDALYEEGRRRLQIAA